MSWGMQEEDRLIDADNVIYIQSTYNTILQLQHTQ